MSAHAKTKTYNINSCDIHKERGKKHQQRLKNCHGQLIRNENSQSQILELKPTTLSKQSPQYELKGTTQLQSIFTF